MDTIWKVYTDQTGFADQIGSFEEWQCISQNKNEIPPWNLVSYSLPAMLLI